METAWLIILKIQRPRGCQLAWFLFFASPMNGASWNRDSQFGCHAAQKSKGKVQSELVLEPETCSSVNMMPPRKWKEYVSSYLHPKLSIPCCDIVSQVNSLKLSKLYDTPAWLVVVGSSRPLSSSCPLGIPFMQPSCPLIGIRERVIWDRGLGR